MVAVCAASQIQMHEFATWSNVRIGITLMHPYSEWNNIKIKFIAVRTKYYKEFVPHEMNEERSGGRKEWGRKKEKWNKMISIRTEKRHKIILTRIFRKKRSYDWNKLTTCTAPTKKHKNFEPGNSDEISVKKLQGHFSVSNWKTHFKYSLYLFFFQRQYGRLGNFSICNLPNKILHPILHT